jgi:hypothetical protein
MKIDFRGEKCKDNNSIWLMSGHTSEPIEGRHLVVWHTISSRILLNGVHNTCFFAKINHLIINYANQILLHILLKRGTKSNWLGSEVTVLYFAHLSQNYKESFLATKISFVYHHYNLNFT